MRRPVVAHPATGELISDVTAQPPEALADLLLALREQQTLLKAITRDVETELRRRVELRTGGEAKICVFGDYEIVDNRTFEREWDPDDLENALRQLVDDGVVPAGDLTGIIRHETRVSRTDAAALLRRLRGNALKTVEACFRWKEKPARLEVKRSIQLPEETT